MSSEIRDRVLSRSFVAVCLATGLQSIAHFFFFPALPLYFERLGGTDAEIGLIFGANSIAALLVRPLVGRWVQDWGAKTVFAIGMVLTMVVAGGYTFATVFVMILLTRMVGGVYMAMLSTAGSTYVADIAPPARRGTAIGLYGSVTMIGQLIGGPIALAILEGTWFRSLDFDVAGLLGRVPHDLNFYSLFLISALIAAVALAATQLMRPTADRRAVVAAGSWRGLFNRQALFPAVVGFCMTANLISVFAFMPLMAKRYDIGNFGYFFTISAVALMAVRVVAGPVSDRFGRAVVILPGMALGAIGTALLAYATGPLTLYLSAVVWGIGSGAAQPALMAYLVDRIRPEVRGTAMSTFTLGNDIGIGLGATLLGFVLQLSNFTVTFLTSGLVLVIGMAIFVLGDRRTWAGRALAGPIRTVPLARADGRSLE